MNLFALKKTFRNVKKKLRSSISMYERYRIKDRFLATICLNDILKSLSPAPRAIGFVRMQKWKFDTPNFLKSDNGPIPRNVSKEVFAICQANNFYLNYYQRNVYIYLHEHSQSRPSLDDSLLCLFEQLVYCLNKTFQRLYNVALGGAQQMTAA